MVSIEAIIVISVMSLMFIGYLFCLHCLNWFFFYRDISPQNEWLVLSKKAPMPWYDVFRNFYGRG